MEQKTPTLGDIVNVQAYKHDGMLYRQWNGLKVIESSPDLVVLFACKTKVAEKRGQRWIIREPMLWFFSSNNFFNTNILLRKSGSFFYTNLSSPSWFEDQTIKYIDYDLDIKIYPNKTVKLVDQEEWKIHKDKYNYPQNLINKIEETTRELMIDINNKDGIFNYDVIDSYVDQLKNQKLIKKNIKINDDETAY